MGPFLWLLPGGSLPALPGGHGHGAPHLSPGLGLQGQGALPFTGQGVGECLGNAHTAGILEFSFPRCWWQLPGSGEALRSNYKRFGKMVRIWIQGTPKLKTAETRDGVGKMPQPVRAPLEVMDMWMETQNWAF